MTTKARSGTLEGIFFEILDEIEQRNVQSEEARREILRSHIPRLLGDDAVLKDEERFLTIMTFGEKREEDGGVVLGFPATLDEARAMSVRLALQDPGMKVYILQPRYVVVAEPQRVHARDLVIDPPMK